MCDMTTKFQVTEFVFDATYPREHPRDTRSPSDRLEIVGSRYVPLNNLHPGSEDVSLLVCHANGFHKVEKIRKEVYS
jgi:hypothetical protein